MKPNSIEGFFTLGNRSLTEEDRRRLGRHWGWMLIAGLIYIALGALAFLMPVASTVSLTVGLAFLLIVGGAVSLVHAFRLRHEPGDAARFFYAAISVVTGGLMLRYPGAGMLGLAFALSFYFFANAAAQWVLFSGLEKHGWNWGLASSVMSFLLGVFIVLTFPFSALWVPGTLLGIELIFAGSSMAALAIHCHNIETHPPMHSPMHSSGA